MSASLPRQTARGTNYSPRTARKRRTASRRDPRCPQGAQARAEGWCRPRRANNAGGALAHGREAEPALGGTHLEALASRTSARTRIAPKQNPGQGPAMSTTRSTRSRTTMAQPPLTIAMHPLENLSGSPTASGRTARLSRGAGHELALCLFTQACEPPNVGHERRPTDGEASCWTSDRWKG